MNEFSIGDKVKILVDAVGETTGVVVNIRPSLMDKAQTIYLVKTPKGFKVWIGVKGLKVISMVKEKVIFT